MFSQDLSILTIRSVFLFGSTMERLHGAGILVMNMVSAVNHVQKALDCGVDII